MTAMEVAPMEQSQSDMASDEYVLYYHALSGRGDYIRLLFAEAGVPFKEIRKDVKAVVCGEQLGAFPTFAPPLLKKGELTLGQTHVISKYLAKKFGLYPDNELDELHAEQVNISIHDFLTEGNVAYHPADIVAPYRQQLEESKKTIAHFRKARLHKWMSYLERVLAHNDGGHGFVIGKKLTYVDISLYQILRAAEANFGEDYASYDDIPLLKAFHTRMAARPNLKAYLASDDYIPLCGDSFM